MTAATTLAHISDPHLSDPAGVGLRQLGNKRLLGYLSWRRHRRHEHSPVVVDALKRDLVGTAPDHVLISGDLTHLGLPAEFRQVRDWLDGLGSGTVTLVPGNHDSYVTEAWETTYRHWLPFLTDSPEDADSLDATFPSLRVRGEIALIGLSTAQPTAPLLASGRLGARQLEKLRAVLAECRAQGLFRIVSLHHPPLPGQIRWRKALRDAEALTGILRAEGAELILHGHSHRSESRTIEAGGRTVPILGVPSASARGWHGEIGLYNRLHLSASTDGWHLTAESRHFDDAEQQFVAATEREWFIRRPQDSNLSQTSR